MRIFITGGSGWIGSVVVLVLERRGHKVVGLARSEESAAKLEVAGAEVLRGDLDEPSILREGAAAADGVIHLAFKHDIAFSADGMVAAAAADRLAIEAMGDALAGSDRPFVIASGTPSVPGRIATERDEPQGAGPAAARVANGAAVVAMSKRGIRSSVVRLPRSVHGRGELHGFIPRLIAMAREKGVSGYVGDGSNRWPAVHVLDAADLFRIALEAAPAGTVLHAVGDEAIPTREIAAAIGRRLNVPTASVPAEDFGFLGRVLAVDQPASSTMTRELTGWQPTHPGLIADLDDDHYFVPTVRGSSPARVM